LKEDIFPLSVMTKLRLPLSEKTIGVFDGTLNLLGIISGIIFIDFP
jgi:hypothetical protein